MMRLLSGRSTELSSSDTIGPTWYWVINNSYSSLRSEISKNDQLITKHMQAHLSHFQYIFGSEKIGTDWAQFVRYRSDLS